MKDEVGLEATSDPDSSLLTFALIISDNANPTELVPSEPLRHTDNADLTDDRRFFFIDL